MGLVLIDHGNLVDTIRFACGPQAADAVAAALWRDGTQIESTRPQWCAFYGGDDPDNSAGGHYYDDEPDAREDAQWLIESGVAKRLVAHGTWIVQPPDEAST